MRPWSLHGTRSSRFLVAANMANTQVLWSSPAPAEANLVALRGSVLAAKERRSHLITQATEHPGVLATCAALSRHHGVRVAVHAAQAAGKIPLDVNRWCPTAESPFGAYILCPTIVRRSTPRDGHGSRSRNGISRSAQPSASSSAASRAASPRAATRATFSMPARRPPSVERQLNGSAAPRLPNTLNVSLVSVVAHDLLPPITALAASAGSACHSGSTLRRRW